MKTQISRDIFKAHKRYSGVYQQMGRMLTDSDWNELVEIARHRVNEALLDVIGSGTPRDRGVLKVLENPDGSVSYGVKWGYLYADGIIAQLRPDPDAPLPDPHDDAFEYERQADFPFPPSLPSGDHILYVDVWERAVTHLEDDQLRDPGLRGADTCTRSQTMAQVKWCPTAIDPENPLQNPPKGTIRLTAQLRGAGTEPDPCDPCAQELDLHEKVGNYLFRVEVHRVHYDGDGLPVDLVIKWSSENGAEQYPIGLEPPGFISSNFAYEFFSGKPEKFASEKHLGRHHAPAFVAVHGALTEEYPSSAPSGFSLVRRWDGFGRFEKSGGHWRLVGGLDRGRDLTTGSAGDAHGHVEEGPRVTINLDAVILEVNLGDHAALAGDFWQVPVREATNVQGDVLLEDSEAAGIKHHYFTLGSVVDGQFRAHEGFQCKRFEFPPLTDIRAKDICYSNDNCSLSGVRTVQEALEHLCRERDLRWHNKHLHGWGIVCGLIAECGPDTLLDRDSEGGEPPRRQVRVTSGYALDCDGSDIVLQEDLVFDLLSRIEKMEEEGEPVLKDGDGTVCLRLDSGEGGQPAVFVEPYDEAKHQKSLLENTLLMDFFQDCILELIAAVSGEFQFLDPAGLDASEGGVTGLVSQERRQLTSFLNLIVQIFNPGNGSYVFLSHREHHILRDIYLRLRELLQSKTYCAMFQGDEFPEYPFAVREMNTFFGKNGHTRVKLHPDGKRLYSYNGTDNTINVYDVEAGELIDVLEMPSAEGAEVSAITFSPDGRILYAAASVKAVDTVFGVARIDKEHHWEKMTIFCDLEITEMTASEQDQGLIYAVGLGRGLFFLRPGIFMEETKPTVSPAYAFNASGHMVIDENEQVAFCTCLSQDEEKSGTYDSIALCNLRRDASTSNADPTHLLILLDPTGKPHRGNDGLAISVAAERDRGGIPAAGERDRGGFLYVVVQGMENNKQLLTYVRRPGLGLPQLQNSVSIENTKVSLAYHPGETNLLLAFEDGYRLQMFTREGVATNFYRIPVQIQPVDIVVERREGAVYALNFISNTVSVISPRELAVSSEFLDDLAAYRLEVLTAFYVLLSGLLQYLKDCFCHHLLVQCPQCGEDEAIYLASVDVRKGRIHKICNFELRKYVKSFPTMGYWFSLVPIWPIAKWLLSKFCCSLLPDFFSRHQDTVIGQAPQSDAGQQPFTHANAFKAQNVRHGLQAYERTDLGGLWRNQQRSFAFTGRVAVDSLSNLAETGRRKEAGVRKQALMHSSVSEAVSELERSHIEVAGIQKYDPAKATSYLADFISTPQRIEEGSKVTLYEKDGRVVFYAVEKPDAGPSVIEIPESLKRNLQELEKRKEVLKDMSAVDAQLEEAERRRAQVAAFEEIKGELTTLQREKNVVQEELATLKSQVDSLRAEREAEAQKLLEMSSRQRDISNEILRLNENLKSLDSMHREISLELEKKRPARDVTGVTADMEVVLRDLGIRTVEDLSRANVQTLTATRRIDAATANAIIANARRQLTRN